jgi:hypothetical protein
MSFFNFLLDSCLLSPSGSLILFSYTYDAVNSMVYVTLSDRMGEKNMERS